MNWLHFGMIEGAIFRLNRCQYLADRVVPHDVNACWNMDGDDVTFELAHRCLATSAAYRRAGWRGSLWGWAIEGLLIGLPMKVVQQDRSCADHGRYAFRAAAPPASCMVLVHDSEGNFLDRAELGLSERCFQHFDRLAIDRFGAGFERNYVVGMSHRGRP